MDKVIVGKPVVPGTAEGEILFAQEPISFWGGYDWKTGEIIDRRHPQSGSIAANKILVVPSSRGSSTTTAVLLEAVKAGKAPAAIVTTQVDFFFALASVVADEIYGKFPPVIAIHPDDFPSLSNVKRIAIDDGSRITIVE